ncbi:MAG: LPXTG cell wall anchor domain-containing protein [Streptomyces sp.]|uniref:LAETG motif-containing sortase-dependent surface protein n=1 Tax=Streptomyces sp. NBC_00028 TaxID=2975624 RepID=UPI0017EA6DC2|nr:LPXTG cell wall anchor domain-containing protein [Streptomyces sp.]NUR39075.1 LPXTG cell wall anchor domain-containing protein [Streptomyces sp.]
MSIARRVTVRRLLGTGAATLAICAFTASVASATDCPGGKGWDDGGSYKPGTGAGTETGTELCEFSLDGKNFFPSVKVDDQNLKPTDDGKVHVTVRTAGNASTCTASLASYRAHGPTFATSGEQVFHDFDTVTVKAGQSDSLDIAIPDQGCYAQIDLYRGNTKFDGKLDANDGFTHGDLPKGPDHPVIKDKLIAAWNGGTKDCTSQPSPTPTPTPSASESTPAEETTPPASESETPTPSASESTPAEETTTPSASESSTAPAATPNGGGDDLAETGASSNTPIIAGGAAALLLGGGAIVLATRRRKATRA